MFTGLIESVGRIASVRRSSDSMRLTVESDIEGLNIGDSISVDGVCQTVVEVLGGSFECYVMAETLRSTNFRSLRIGALVNLERAIAAGERLGGHIVTGHIDAVGAVRMVKKNPASITVKVPSDLMDFIAPKGSVAVNGVSLTVGPKVSRDTFDVFLIPHTLESTNLRLLRVGDKVNIEVDLFARYIVNFLKEKNGR